MTKPIASPLPAGDLDDRCHLEACQAALADHLVPVASQDELAGDDQRHAGIGGIGIVIDEGRGHVAPAVNGGQPQYVVGRYRKDDEPVERVDGCDQRNGIEQRMGAARVSAELERKPEHACARDKPKECEGGEVTVNTNAARSASFERLRRHLPDGMRRRGRRTGVGLDKDEGHYRAQQRDGVPICFMPSEWRSPGTSSESS